MKGNSVQDSQEKLQQPHRNQTPVNHKTLIASSQDRVYEESGVG